MRNKWSNICKTSALCLTSLQVLDKLYLFLLYCYFIFIMVLCHASALSPYTKSDIYLLSLQSFKSIYIFKFKQIFNMNMKISAKTMSINFVPVVVKDAKEDRSVLEKLLVYSGRHTLHNRCMFQYFTAPSCHWSIVFITWSQLCRAIETLKYPM